MRNRQVTRELQRLRKARPPGPSPHTPWAEDAACRGHDLATDLWADDAKPVRTAAAKAVCAAYPVRAACLAHALTHDEPWGIWGGRTTRERVAIKLGVDNGLGGRQGDLCSSFGASNRAGSRCE